MSKVEFVVFSDFHAHNFKAYSRLSSHGTKFLNSRLVDSLEVLSEIREYCGKNRIKAVLFGGDLFHTRQAVRTDVITSVHSEILRFNMDGIALGMIPGNHDYANKRGNIHSLSLLTQLPEVRVISYPERIFFDDFIVYGLPYTESLEHARDHLVSLGLAAEEDANDTSCPKILLAHLGMQGARVGSDYVLVSDGDVGVADVPEEDFDLCLFGHFHEHQKLFKNGWVIGATHQHNWGDSGGSRGFLHVTIDTETRKVDIKQIPTNAPRFVNVTHENDIADLRPRDIVRVPAAFSESLKDDIRDKITKFGFLEEVTETVTTQDVGFSSESLNPNDMLEEWIESQDTKLPSEELLNLGKELLTEASKDE